MPNIWTQIHMDLNSSKHIRIQIYAENTIPFVPLAEEQRNRRGLLLTTITTEEVTNRKKKEVRSSKRKIRSRRILVLALITRLALAFANNKGYCL